MTSQERFCQYCGRSNAILDEEPVQWTGEGEAKTGGYLIILSAVLSLISIPVIWGYLDSLEFNSELMIFSGLATYKDIFAFIAGVLLVLGVLSILGGVSALSVGNYRWAFLGGLASVFSVAGALGFAGLMLVRTSRGSFRSVKGESVGGLGPDGPREPQVAFRGSEHESKGGTFDKSLFMRR